MLSGNEDDLYSRTWTADDRLGVSIGNKRDYLGLTLATALSGARLFCTGNWDSEIEDCRREMQDASGRHPTAKYISCPP